MKTIVLATSIFFLLGLKISNKVDFVNKSNSTNVVSNKLEYPEKQAVNYQLKKAPNPKTDMKTAVDTSKTTKSSVIKFR